MLPPKGTRLVAKVYDPLYFNDSEGYLNPFLCMDRSYTHEANAYMALNEFQGQWIPRYYGSYSLTKESLWQILSREIAPSQLAKVF
jgi:hypothetical protein